MLTTIKKFGFEVEAEYPHQFTDSTPKRLRSQRTTTVSIFQQVNAEYDKALLPRSRVRLNNTDKLQAKLEEHGEFKGDGSIHTCGAMGKTTKAHVHPLEALEYVTEPLEYNDTGKAQAEEMLSTLEALYEAELYHYNDSQGFHIHLSFAPTVPPELYSVQFYDYFMGTLQKEFPDVYKKRIASSRWCRPLQGKNGNPATDYAEKALAIVTDHERYRALNFLGALTRHGTLEVRVFPGDTPAKLRQYLAFTFSTIENFLAEADTLLNERHALYV